MTISKNILAGSGAVAEPYEINQSLIFSQTNDYLKRIPSSAGNRRTFTLSYWVKIGTIDGTSRVILTAGTSNSDVFHHNFESGGTPDDALRVVYYASGAFQINVTTNRVFRDPSAWYHIVLAIDTTQGTAANRVKMYVNGVQETSFATSVYPSQNLELNVNTATAHWIGQYHSADFPLRSYLAETHFIDGTALTPSSFGETNSATGQWIPKEYGGSYGTNGFYLKFVSGAIGTDSSGQGNNHSVSNISNAYILLDTPTNNFCTLSSLNVGATFYEGNLKATTAASDGRRILATIGVESGKWYWEFKPLGNVANGIALGVTLTSDVTTGNLAASAAPAWGWYSQNTNDGYSVTSSTYSQIGPYMNANDVIGAALDLDNSTITFYKNGSAANVAITIPSSGLFIPVFGDGTNSGGSSFEVNFGQKTFAHTPPSGHVALSTANLPNPAIALPEKHFNTALYAGNNAANRAITTGMEPDLVWLKTRNATNWHNLFDSVRGAGAVMYSNANTAETTRSDSLTGFSSTGFTVSQNAAYNDLNASDHTYVSWNWKAGGSAPTKTYAVKVVSDSGNKYRFDDFAASAQTVDMQEGGTYTFDQSDSSNSNHPLRFSVTSNGSHGGGSEYTTGVVTTGSPGSSGAKTVITVAASAPTLYYYCTNHSGMGGQANTNSTRGSTNFTGSSKGIVSANVAAGFSIVSFTGTGAWQTLGHELGVIPEVVITKARSVQQDWYWVHTEVDGTLDYMVLNTAVPNANGSATVPTSSVFQTQYAANQTNIAYCFASKPGFSKIGVYKGNGNADGPFVNCGFKPAYILIKRTTAGTDIDWYQSDSASNPTNDGSTLMTWPNHNYTQQTHTGYAIDYLSNGFKLRNASGYLNASNAPAFYMAFAESPFKYANAR